MQLVIEHARCLEDNCTETHIGLVPDTWTLEDVKKALINRGREPIFVDWTDGYIVEDVGTSRYRK